MDKKNIESSLVAYDELKNHFDLTNISELKKTHINIHVFSKFQFTPMDFYKNVFFAETGIN